MNLFRQSPWKTGALCLLAAVLLTAVPALAQEEAMEGMEGMEHGEMSADEAAMMETWMKAMTPGPQHEMLQGMAGEWKFSITSWMEGSDEPMVSDGTAHRKMELGGRVLEEVVESSMMGQPFEGIGRTGYDNLTGEWWSTWTDNMTTGLMMMTGTWDEASKTWTWTGEGTNPMTGGAQKMKMTVVREGENKEVGTMWQSGADGEKVGS